MADSKTCTIRTRKFLTNRLLDRKQFVRIHDSYFARGALGDEASRVCDRNAR